MRIRLTGTREQIDAVMAALTGVLDRYGAISRPIGPATPTTDR
jgi:hypothetical protein